MAEIITIARPYAVALYRRGKDKKSLAVLSKMLSFLSDVVVDENMQSFINNPKVTSLQLQENFLAICGDKINQVGANLIKLLIEYKRLSILPDIAKAFEILKAEDEGMLDAEITAASQPSDSEVKAIVLRLEQKFGKKIEASVKVDPELIGGIKILVGDTVIDASVKGQLQQLAYTLIS